MGNLIDTDLIRGRKAITIFLQLSGWGAVLERINNGLPVAKVGGNWEMSITAYRSWRENLIKNQNNRQGQ